MPLARIMIWPGRWQVISGIAVLALGLIATPVTGADPGNDCATFLPRNCSTANEFDWALPYYDAFERHGIGYLADREGIPLMNATDTMCRGKTTSEWNYFNLTTVEFQKVVEAASDVYPEMLR